MKTDNSIRNICIAAIRRKVILPFDFLLTQLFEKETFPDIDNEQFKLLDLYDNELPITQTTIDHANWTLVTTRQIISCADNTIQIAKAAEVLSWHWNDFKGYDKAAYTVGQLQLAGQQQLGVFIETGRASMITIYAIRTVVGQSTK
jgi:hypothetical protein